MRILIYIIGFGDCCTGKSVKLDSSSDVGNSLVTVLAEINKIVKATFS